MIVGERRLSRQGWEEQRMGGVSMCIEGVVVAEGRWPVQ